MIGSSFGVRGWTDLGGGFGGGEDQRLRERAEHLREQTE